MSAARSGGSWPPISAHADHPPLAGGPGSLTEHHATRLVPPPSTEGSTVPMTDQTLPLPAGVHGNVCVSNARRESSLAWNEPRTEFLRTTAQETHEVYPKPGQHPANKLKKRLDTLHNHADSPFGSGLGPHAIVSVAKSRRGSLSARKAQRMEYLRMTGANAEV